MSRWLLALFLITAWWWTGACAMSHELAQTAAFVASSGDGPVDKGDYPDHEQVIRGVAAAPADPARAKWQPAVLGGSLPIDATWSSEAVRLTWEVSRCPASRRVVPERARAPPLGRVGMISG